MQRPGNAAQQQQQQSHLHSMNGSHLFGSLGEGDCGGGLMSGGQNLKSTLQHRLSSRSTTTGKCFQCPNADLCGKCEAAGVHPEYRLIRVTGPMVLYLMPTFLN